MVINTIFNNGSNAVRVIGSIITIFKDSNKTFHRKLTIRNERYIDIIVT